MFSQLNQIKSKLIVYALLLSEMWAGQLTVHALIFFLARCVRSHFLIRIYSELTARTLPSYGANHLRTLLS